ncbi:MAG: UvrD-helicase domain-containing protein, partial [Pseudomonadota bacterium]
MSGISADQAARRLALEPHRSFCVLAPAGSGKTELLTQRLLKLLTVCEQPEQILAITFTRKAAGEMQARLLANLRVAANTPLAQDAELSPHALTTRQLARAALAQDHQQGWNLLDNPQRLRLTTIDSFTSYLTARLPFAANFGARPELTTDTDAMFRQAVHATLALLEGDDAAANALSLLLPHLHNSHQTAESLLLDLLKKRADWLPLLTPLAGDPQRERRWLQDNMHSLLIEQLTTVRNQLLPYQSTLMELVMFVVPYLEACGDLSLSMLKDSAALPPASAAGVPAWQAMAQLFLKADGNFRAAVTKKQGFIAKADCKDKAEAALVQGRKDMFKQLIAEMDAAGTLPAWQSLLILPPAGYSEASWPVIAALLTLLPMLAAQLHIAMKGAGKIDHVETSLAALTALGSEEQPTDLALRLDYQLRHILVDEFQDTSHTQFTLLEKLTAGWHPGDGRTLFIVGDGMQSCYGFRNADVSLFLRARDAGIGSVKLEPLQLSVNFRSNAGVVEWVNTVFAAAFPPQDDVLRGGVTYSHSEASKPSEGAGVQCVLQYSDKDEEGDDGDEDNTASPSSIKQQLRQQEAEAVAALCQRLQQEQPDDNIAILVRNRSHLTDVVQALRKRQLKWNASEIDRLLSYQEIADLHALLRALLNVADLTAWLALLRSPLIGLALADLELLATTAHQQQAMLWSVLQDFTSLTLSEDAQQRLQRCVPSLQRARQQRQQLPLRDLLEMTWLELGGASVLAD